MAANRKKNGEDLVPADAGRKMKRGFAPLHRFRPHPDNPRTHPPAEIAMLADLMTRYGADQDIVVDEDWYILKGHGRRDAALIARFDGFPYTQRTDLTEAEKIAMRIEDNQVTLLAGWNKELVAGAVHRLNQLGYEITRLGFGDAQLVQFTTLPGPPAGGFQQFGADIATEYQCPACSYCWSGNPKPVKDNAADGKKDSVQVRVSAKASAARRPRKAAKVSSRSPLAGKTPSRKDKTAGRKLGDDGAGNGAAPKG